MTADVILVNVGLVFVLEFRPHIRSVFLVISGTVQRTVVELAISCVRHNSERVHDPRMDFKTEVTFGLVEVPNRNNLFASNISQVLDHFRLGAFRQKPNDYLVFVSHGVHQILPQNFTLVNQKMKKNA